MYITSQSEQKNLDMKIDIAHEVRAGEALDWSALAAYLQEQIPTLEGESLQVKQFLGGHANLTYLLLFGEKEFVLRRPPFGKIAPGAHDMKREYKVLSKLFKHFAPAPRAFLYCEEDAVIGAPFVLMERRTGVVIRYQLQEEFKVHDQVEKRLTDALINAQSELHGIDINAAELDTLGKPAGFLDRQLAGWSKRWNLSKTEDNSNMDEVLEALQQDIPKPQAASIIHNDFKFDNCQFQLDNPDLVTSIFDWDMCTIGDPLLDFGSTLSYWQDDRFAGVEMPIMMKGRFPDKDYIKSKYAKNTGFDLSRINWYEAFALWKNAVIVQQLYTRYVNGATKDKRMANLGEVAKELARVAKMVVTV